MHRTILIHTALAVLMGSHMVLSAEADDNPDPKSSGIGGVRATFSVKNKTVHLGEPVIVKLTLKNTLSRPAKFSFLPAFILHVHLYDTNRKEVEQRIDAPVLEAIRRDLLLGPGQALTIDNKLDLKLFYDLRPSRYYLRFFYDLRLIGDRAMFERYRLIYHSSDLVLWDSKYYPFSVVK